jgi:protein-tyrosine phosphatase
VGGKDRTGLVTALVLRVAGVEPDVVAADYALTEAALAPTHEQWVAEAPDEAVRRRRLLLQPAPPSVMTAVLEALEERYGGVPAYLRGAGVDDDVLDRVRERLLAAP